MKIPIFTLLILSFCSIQSSDVPPKGWMLGQVFTQENGNIVQEYHLIAGPDPKPLDIKILEKISPAFYCCPRRIRKHILEYENSYIETVSANPETKAFILKRYFHFK